MIMKFTSDPVTHQINREFVQVLTNEEFPSGPFDHIKSELSSMENRLLSTKPTVDGMVPFLSLWMESKPSGYYPNVIINVPETDEEFSGRKLRVINWIKKTALKGKIEKAFPGQVISDEDTVRLYKSISLLKERAPDVNELLKGDSSDRILRLLALERYAAEALIWSFENPPGPGGELYIVLEHRNQVSVLRSIFKNYHHAVSVILLRDAVRSQPPFKVKSRLPVLSPVLAE